MSVKHDHPQHQDHAHRHDDSEVAHRTRALEELLVRKGLLKSEDIDSLVSRVEQDIGPMVGARVVAHAWTDPAFKRRLLEDAPAAIADLDIDLGERL